MPAGAHPPESKGSPYAAGTGKAYVVCASSYGGPKDPGTPGTSGKYGDLKGKMAFAELNMGTALGNLPPHTKLRITYVTSEETFKRQVVAEKLDIGAGGGPCSGHARRIDLWYQTAEALGFSGLDLVLIERLDGGPIVGPLDSNPSAYFQRNTTEGLTEPFGGPHSEGAAEAGVNAAKKAAEEALSWTKELGKVLHFLGSGQGWARIGKVVLGVALLIIAIDQLTKIGPTPETNLKTKVVRKGL